MATLTSARTLTSTSNVADFATSNFTPASGDLLFAVSVYDGTTSVQTLTDSLGGAWSRITEALKSSSADLMTLFVRDALVTSGSSVSVGVTTQTAGTGCLISVGWVTGMSRAGTSAVRQSARRQNQGAGTSAVHFAAPCLTSNSVAAFLGNSTNAAGMSPPTGFSEVEDFGHATPAKGLEVAYVNNGFTDSGVTWGSNSASVYGAIAIEFDTSAAPSATANPGYYPRTSQRYTHL